MQVATPLFEPCDDSSGIVIGVFHDACALLGEIALAAWTSPEALADAVVEALRDNGYGQYDGLIAMLTPALEAEGLELVQQRIETMAAMPVPVPPKDEREAVGYADEHLATCAELAGRIEDFGEHETHNAYLAHMKTQHGRKYGFWSLTDA